MSNSGGSRISHWGGSNLQCRCFSVKMYAKMKELDPVGGAHTGSAPWICQWSSYFVLHVKLITYPVN